MKNFKLSYFKIVCMIIKVLLFAIDHFDMIMFGLTVYTNFTSIYTDLFPQALEVAPFYFELVSILGEFVDAYNSI